MNDNIQFLFDSKLENKEVVIILFFMAPVGGTLILGGLVFNGKSSYIFIFKNPGSIFWRGIDFSSPPPHKFRLISLPSSIKKK